MSKKLKAVLVGAGGITGAWLTPLKKRDDVEIIAVADPVRESAEKRISEFSLDAVYYPSLANALENVKADIVFDCSIPEAHCANSILALSKGCHVLSEKPMAKNLAEAKDVIKAAKLSGKTHAVIQNRRYLNEIVSYRNAVRENIGGLTTLNADFYIGAHFGGFRDVMEHVLLLDMAVHSFDQARFISGCDPVSVFCKEWNPGGSWYRHGASAVAVFTMTDNVVFTYRGSWCAEGCNTSWECSWRAVGTKGSATLENTTVKCERPAGSGEFINKCETVEIPETSLDFTGHPGVIHEFMTCLKNGKSPQTVCTDNIKSLAMVEGAIASAESGREVEISI